MADDPTTAALVSRVREGDKAAWDEIVQRYAPLVWSICRRHRLNDADTDDVGQEVWLRLVELVAVIRDAAALPGWLATTTRRLCLGVLESARHRADLTEASAADPRSERSVPGPDDLVLRAERNQVIRTAIAELPPRCQLLLYLLTQTPRLSYAEIAAKLDEPIGGLGPRRARCLRELRRMPQLAALIEAETGPLEGGEERDQPMVER
jgi:RNA polymerase sigma factor (sigma-70 family)